MIEKLGTDPWEKNTHMAESLPALNDTFWGPAYLSDMNYAYGPAYAINAIDHFRITFGLFFKASPGAHLFI